MENVTNTVLTTIIMSNLEKVSNNMTRLINRSTTSTATISTTPMPTSSALDSYSELYNDTISSPSSLSSSSSSSVTVSASPLDVIKELTSQVTFNKSSKSCTTTTTEEPFDEFGPPDGVEYIFVPLGVMIFVIVLSAVVLIISRRRKLERLRHRLMPLYNFDPGEEGEDDWETELLDEGLGTRQRRQGYQSMDNEENAELFSH